MSALIDIWTCELAKLREKGQNTMGSNGVSSSTTTATAAMATSEKEKGQNMMGSNGVSTTTTFLSSDLSSSNTKMSALIDIWTCELAKLREKGQNMMGSNGVSSSTTTTTAAKPTSEKEAAATSSGSTSTRVVGFKSSPQFHYSEATISIIMDCCCP